jgi:hypothetical protein
LRAHRHGGDPNQQQYETELFALIMDCLSFSGESSWTPLPGVGCDLLMKSNLWERNNWTMVSTILWYWLARRVVFSRAVDLGDGVSIKHRSKAELISLFGWTEFHWE